MAKIFRTYLLISIAALLATACSDKKPRSGGKPYDVIIVTNDEASGRVVMREMSECSEYFTRNEQMFNISLTKDNGTEDAIRLARTLIVVDTASVEHTVAMRERNMWAYPQLILYVHTPSAEQLAKDFKELKMLFAREINDFERNLVLNTLEHQRNMQLEDSVIRYTGTQMMVPASMKIAAAEKDFVWLTSYSGDENQSLCVYRTHKNSVDVLSMTSVTHLRDSLMHRINGAAADARWKICKGTERAETRNDTVIVRNRWEMTGDAMGGTSACRIIARGDSVTFAEVFLYAPASDKRTKMRRLEALLYSIR